MDEKKVREAIEFLQRKICTLDAQKEYDEYCNPVHNETLDLAIGLHEIAIEALEKQLPKKVEVKEWSPARCPSCGAELSESLGDGYYRHPTFLKRCPNVDCGQRLDWSE